MNIAEIAKFQTYNYHILQGYIKFYRYAKKSNQAIQPSIQRKPYGSWGYISIHVSSYQAMTNQFLVNVTNFLE